MKYTSEYINELSFRGYLEIMASELNENGFRDYDGSEYEVDDDPKFWKYFMMGPVNDPKAMAFLKNQGLIENGRCPTCGAPMSTGQRYYWYDRRDPSKRIYLCYGCHNTNFRGDGHSMDGTPNGVATGGSSSTGSGCLGAILLLPIVLFKAIINSIL